MSGILGCGEKFDVEVLRDGVKVAAGPVGELRRFKEKAETVRASVGIGDVHVAAKLQFGHFSACNC